MPEKKDLSSETILTVDSTIIAGVLILLAISSSDVTNLKDNWSIADIIFTPQVLATTIIYPFAISAVWELYTIVGWDEKLNNFYQKHPKWSFKQKPRDLHRDSIKAMIFGFLYLAIIGIVVVEIFQFKILGII